MSKKNKLELIVAKYLKILTNGSNLKVKVVRIWTIILIPFWVIGLISSVATLIKGIDDIESIENIKSNIQKNRNDSYISFKKFYGPPENREFSEDVYRNSMDLCEKENDRYAKEYIKTKSHQEICFSILPLFILVGFILPFIITRLVYWVMRSDKVIDKDKS